MEKQKPNPKATDKKVWEKPRKILIITFQHTRGQSPINKRSIAAERSTHLAFPSSDVTSIYFNLAISASVSGTLL